MNLFAKRNHFDKFTPIGLFLVSCALTALTVVLDATHHVYAIGWFFVTLVLTMFVCRYLSTCGLYIQEEHIFYKTFRIKNIDIREIAAVRITKAVWRTNSSQLFHPDIDWTDTDGRQLYSMVFYHEYRPQSMCGPDYGDRFFVDTFLDSVLFRTVYNKDVLQYLKKENPKLIIILANGEILE